MGKKPNAFLAKVEERMNHNMALQREFTMQQCEDIWLIMLHEDFGFGPARCQKAQEKFRETLLDFCKLCVEDGDDDKEIVYTKASVDRQLQGALGDAFKPWEERYPADKYR